MATEVFRHSHRVTYAECTMGNHIYYARYLDLLEAARGEFFRSLGTTLRHWQLDIFSIQSPVRGSKHYGLVRRAFRVSLVLL